MKCNATIRSFLELDNYMVLPFSIRLHMVFCKKCREEIYSLQNTFSLLRESAPFDMLDSLSSLVMNSIYASPVYYGRNVSSTKWLSVGGLIVLSMMGITFSNSFASLKGYFGEYFEIPLNIVMGLVITVYVAFFIGSHLEETKKFLSYFDRKAH
ncbi:MAG: hypothetical protein MUC95_08205 [Spirochaetes bacterium]|jgi:hypothetical protein|nr:hypothetical protein [Spirochaetota bacterium]